MQKLFLTFFGTGLLKPAPGTWGSLAGAVFGVLIFKFIGDQTLFLASLLLFLASIKVINDYESKTGSHDANHIVIDEVAGVWLTISISGETWMQIALSIIFFRVLDITKPSIIGRIDKNVKGGLGVMGDDMVAGLFAGLLSAIVYQAINYVI
ncbi:phosphatidylglycerophosphatase A [Campylobacter hyointestinalis subsp. hyointestinalis]|uniref:Phosphatidylglycerophosphatase A n=1 Tax=Campylobacter hyointestinalis subsp. hyointestinalis TaxID=91352 RepID=A0A0S4RQX8_CAMHY|nr:phosphatidylglycerophosphatase A [Campylobacter hyointestinalis]CUU67851.1 phosphatidylglycerophosphatase A [Campylobacter hyointestinalis subsp. hyointestinalis]CUU75726.1 phosphatidylglycerophosphatase A [Campylobacter hyointestinalis subsp. hyointestinalis]CUU76089.1 phosphatidylglycerophosphatase A [Campylobacter hyointestinalis subsp. hyointestinalis]